VVTVALQVVDAGSVADGVNVAVKEGESYDTVPVTVVVPHVRIKVPAFTEGEATSSLNTALTVVLIATPAALFAGVVVETVGGVLSFPT
jgi:hypothetical protein